MPTPADDPAQLLAAVLAYRPPPWAWLPRCFSRGSTGARLIRQLPTLLREHRLDPTVDEGLYTSPAGFTSWSSHRVQAVET